LPAPLVTTRGRGWACAPVDVYAVGNAVFTTPQRENLVCVQLCGEARIRAEANGECREHHATPGHVMVAPAGQAATWRRSGEGFVLMAAIAPGQLADVLERAEGRSGTAVRVRSEFAGDDIRIAELSRVLWRELARERIGARLYVETAVGQLVVQLIREHCEIDLARAPAISISPHKLRLANAFIQENLSEDLSVEGIARAVGMSAFHFAHAFRAATGVPPHRYVMQRRMERARALLRGSELTLTEIAQRVGYSSASHFSVGFRKLMHVAPSDYRKSA
jgi:AraC family transcriptional regulator